MIIEATFKDSSAISEALNQALHEKYGRDWEFDENNEDVKKIWEISRKYMYSGAYITIIFNTDEETATVKRQAK